MISKYESMLESAKKLLSDVDVEELENNIRAFHDFVGNNALRQLAMSLEAIRIEEANKKGWELFKTYDTRSK